jgi:hypothetical protein
MKQKGKNIINKAGVLLIASVMILSILPAITADTIEQDKFPGKHSLTNFDDNTYRPNRQDPNVHHRSAPRIPFGSGGSFAPGDVMFEQPPISSSSPSWSLPFSDAGHPTIGLRAYDDFGGLTADIAGINWWGLEAYGDDTLVGNTFEIAFYNDVGGMPDIGNPQYTHTGVVGTDITQTPYGDSFAGYTGYFFEFAFPSDVPMTSGWLSVYETLPADGEYFAWISVEVGQGWNDFSYQAAATPPENYFDLSMQLIEGGGGPGPGPSGECIEDVCDFEIVALNQAYMYEGKINELPQIINVTVRNNGEVGINEVKLLADVYEKICGDTHEKYCDEKYDLRFWEMETADNFTIVDDDPVEGDSWVLQGGPDNRWVTNNQAWRCTAGEDRSYGGDEDTYLGLSDDAVGTDDLIFDPVDPICKNDIGGAACATFTFKHWAEGEYTHDADGNVIPVDYGTLSYCLNGTGIWTAIPTSDFVAYDTGGEWQEVTIKFINESYYSDVDQPWKVPYKDICPDCEPDENDIVVMTDFPADGRIQFRWSWHKDPCYNFEGWYIDEICITRTEKYYLELIHQAHMIFPMDGCDPEHGPVNIYKEFELGWDPDPDTWYQIDICGQVFSPNNCEFDTENNCWHTQFYVTDIHDIMCVDMELLTPNPTNPGEPVSVNMTIKNIGTYAEDDVPISLKVADCVISTPTDDDFETDPSGRWSFAYFVGFAAQNYWRWTKGDATIDGIGDGRSVLPGSEAMTCSEEQPTYPRIPENVGNFMETGSTYDTADLVSADLEFYLKYSIDDVNSNGDYFAIYFHPITGPDSDFWYAAGEHVFTGYSNDFIFVEIDLKDRAMDFAYDVGGETIIPEIEFGFAVITDANDGETVNPNNPIPWSGVILDNVKISIVSCGGNEEEVGTYTSGTLAPGEEETLLLTWSAAEFCNHCIIGDVNLATDVDTTNDICSLCVRVIDSDPIDEFESDDLTGEGDCLWHLCDSRGGGDDTYAWAGVEEEHWAHYVHDMDDNLISPPINLSGATDGASLNFTTWYKFYNQDDFGEVYARGSSSEQWTRLNKLMGTSYGYFVDLGANDGYYIAPELCTETTQIKFRMVSDPADAGYDPENDVSEGWYVDDIEIIDVLGSGSFGSFAAWDLLFDFDCEAASGALGNAGAEFDGTYYYSTRWASNLIHQYDDTGALVKEFSIPGVSGLRDLAYDGTYFYGGAGGTIWKMDFDTETLVDTISGGFQSRALAYNPDDDVLYASNWGDPVYVVDPSTGNVDDTFNLVTATSTYGMAYDNAGTKLLYIFDQSISPSDLMIYEWDLDGGAMTGFSYDVQNEFPGISGIAGGLFTDSAGFPGLTVIGGLAQGTPDTMFVYELRAGGAGGDYIFGDLLWSDDFERENIAPWQCAKSRGGDYWEHFDTSGFLPDSADPAEDYWVCHGYPSHGKGLNNVLFAELDLTAAPTFDDITYAELYFKTAWLMEKDVEAFIEISADWDGSSPMEDATWVTFWSHEGQDETNWLTSRELVDDDRFVLNQYLGNVIHVRFRYTTPGEGFSTDDFGGWAIDDVGIEFKSVAFVDEEPPVTSICFDTVTGEVTLLAVDYPIPKGSGVKATYFKIDGGATETYVGSFLLDEGTHTVEFWSEDNAGNMESHKTRTYTLDKTPPTVELTSPEDGKLYLFGSPIMDRILGSGTLCIGKVPVAASATDAGSGVALVMFAFDNGDSGFDDDGSDGYTYDYRGMHFGDLTITATAIDEGGLMSSSDSMTITVYSLGLM